MNDLRLKQEVFAAAQAVLGVLILALVMVGIGGTIYKVISPEGWIAQVFGRSMSAAAAAIGSLLMIVGFAWFSRGWSVPRRRTPGGDALVLACAAAGLLYVAQFLISGSF